MYEPTLYTKILESNLINFIIMIAILVAIFKKFKLGAIFDKMADEIKTSVMTSSEAAQIALKEYREAKRSTKNLEDTKNKIMQHTDDTVQNAKNASREAILKEKEVLENQFLNRAKSDLIKAKDDTTREFLGAVVKLSKDEILNRLNSDNGREIQLKLVNRCIENLDNIDFSEVRI